MGTERDTHFPHSAPYYPSVCPPSSELGPPALPPQANVSPPRNWGSGDTLAWGGVPFSTTGEKALYSCLPWGTELSSRVYTSSLMMPRGTLS